MFNFKRNVSPEVPLLAPRTQSRIDTPFERNYLIVIAQGRVPAMLCLFYVLLKGEEAFADFLEKRQSESHHIKMMDSTLSEIERDRLGIN